MCSRSWLAITSAIEEIVPSIRETGSRVCVINAKLITGKIPNRSACQRCSLLYNPFDNVKVWLGQRAIFTDAVAYISIQD